MKNKLWKIPINLVFNQQKSIKFNKDLLFITQNLPIKLACSLSVEYMVLTHAILANNLIIDIFILYTKRLHSQTLGHFKSYPSIGCKPCTRLIRFFEDIRAGCWRREDAQNKQCGLHKI
jgi:3'-phosphoadenosine 5'-phosphosulfate sulfotransferase (PAPS reductase)/FAD synthetase